ncbi:MAG TPA: hypothetical protein VD996_04155, partial [Chitinophagaceae bacterium]|nr:hypothetical protein [Chitinophagaceae bacterium]
MSKFFLFIFVLATSLPAAAQPGVMLAESGMANNRLSQKWLDALKTRMSPERRDSFASLQRNLTLQE